MRWAYSWENEVPYLGLNTAKVMVPEGRRRSQEICVRLRLEPTSILQPSVMFFPSTAFTFSGTTTWLLLTPAERKGHLRQDSDKQQHRIVVAIIKVEDWISHESVNRLV